MNEKRDGIIFRNIFTENLLEKCQFFRNFEDILVRKTLLDFSLPLKKQVVMSNSNTFQSNVNTFVKSDDLRRADTKKSLNRHKVVVVCSAKLLTTFFLK